MNQTQKNIKAYKAALPDLRERVIAVALLLAMSLAMMTSATFAWLTISASPELTAVNTTVASNGNLEIALVQGDGTKEPAASAVGDSLLDIAERNVTWGNLVNLSDESYGLDNLTLRPAQLNRTALLTNPLYGAVYTADGRIQTLTSNFAYTQWIPPEGNIPGYFEVSKRFGVRAISSTKIVAHGFDQVYRVMKEDAIASNTMAGNAYLDIAGDKGYMENLAYIIGTHMTATINSSASDPADLRNPTLDPSSIETLIEMYGKFLEAMDKEADAMAKLLNFQLLIKYGMNNYTPLSAEYLMSRDANGNFTTTQAVLESQGLRITDLGEFHSDYKQLETDIKALKNLSESGLYQYKYLTTNAEGKEVQDPAIRDMNEIINALVNLNACTLNGTLISKISTTDAAAYNNKSCKAVLTNGVLWEFERRTGANIYVGEEYNSRKGLKVQATAYISSLNWRQSGTIYAIIYTSQNAEKMGTEPVDSLFLQDLAYAESQFSGAIGGTESATDTYGMAIDLWVRTNAPGTYLTLEGNVLTEQVEEPVTGKNANGVEVPLYTFTQTIPSAVEGEEPSTYEIDVYKVETKDADGNVTKTEWYNANTHVAYTAEELQGQTPIAKMQIQDIVIGYEGENRVWDRDSNSLISVNATTQGSGSCYVYYADTPEDQAQSLELLKSMKVVFIDGNGKLLAEAYMDTERIYAVNGRVTVPLMLSSSSINLGVDEDNDTIYAITAMEQNVAKRITALIYLDGTGLDNEDVLAAAAIQGQLNIQFGTSEVLEPIRNEDLENAERSATAVVDINYFDYDTHEGEMKVNVTLTIDGDLPKTVTGFFMRAISESQGSREESRTFAPTGNSGEYTASFTFDGPGTYVLRTVRLDGVDYDLQGEVPTVTVEGFSISSLSCEEANEDRVMTVMTASNTTTAHLNLSFETHDINRMPTKVQGRYVKNGDETTTVTVDFNLNATTQVWTGAATFRQSGEYTLQYLLLDGEHTALPENKQQHANVALGMRVYVSTGSPTRFIYKPSEEEFPDYLNMKVKVMDNTGAEKAGLNNVWLYYSAQGSGNRYMRAELTWNPSTEYYEGQFIPASDTAGPGNYNFTYVGVGDSTLTTATSYPTFQIMSPNPPAYVTTTTTGFQFNTSGTATMNVHLTDAAGATIQATIHSVNENKDHLVIGTQTGESVTEDGTITAVYSFTIPNGISGSTQDGDWQLTGLTIWDAFAPDGTEYTEDDPLEIDLSKTNNTTKVVAAVKVTFPAGQSLTLGKDATGKVTGQLLQTFPVDGLNVSITDYFGNPLVNEKGQAMISNVALQYVYKNGSCLTNGGYSGNGLTNATEGATISIPLDQVTGGTKFSQSSAVNFLYAGNYDVTFTYSLNGMPQSHSGATKISNTPEISVWTVAPSVRITAAQYANKGSDNGSSFTDTATTVVFRETTEKVCSITYYNYTPGKVTITMSGYGYASEIKMEFTTSNQDGKVHLYPEGQQDDGTSTNAYVWTGNTGCARYIGWWESKTGSDEKAAAGILTGTKLIVTYGSMTFEVDVPDITITNQS